MTFQFNGSEYEPRINGEQANEVRLNGETIWTASSDPIHTLDFDSSDSVTDHFSGGQDGWRLDRAEISTYAYTTPDASLQGNIYSGDQGGQDMVHSVPNRNKMHARWYQLIPSGTTGITDGNDVKFPSLSNSNIKDPADGTNHWNARQECQRNSGSWRTHMYVYHADMGTYGENTDHWSSWFDEGQWYQFDQWVDLGTAGEHDGEIHLWIDETLEIEHTGLRFRDAGVDLPIRVWWTNSWQNDNAVSEDVLFHWDDFQFWESKQL